VDRKALRKYVAPAVAAGIAPGGHAKSEQEWHDLVRVWFPELADTRLRQVTWPAIAEHHDLHRGAAQGQGADVDDPPVAAGRAGAGRLGRQLDPVTGKLRTVWAFVMVLACSRHMFVRPVLKMDQRAWVECHVEAFAFFGGVPVPLVLENVAGNIFGLMLPAALCVLTS
jgi:hypothetical protein